MTPESVATAKLIAPLVSSVSKALAESAKGPASRLKERLEIKFQKGFTEYLSKLSERYRTLKTIISSNNPILLKDIYVNVYLSSDKYIIRDDDFVKNPEKYKHVIFTAIAGSGKSMLMRYLFLRFLEEQQDRIPVFIDLRDMNAEPQVSIREFILNKIKEYIPSFSMYQFDFAAEQGRLAIFLDGFDEIDFQERKKKEAEINKIALRFPKLILFLSSRPSDNFARWEKFHVFRVQPFTKKQVELLISKIAYDDDVKRLFQKKLDEGLYETHKEFLVNPLLSIMMLITLDQYAEIPAKIHLFYEKAFDALFSKHDMTKGGFQRKRHTTLALDDFKRLFSYFCTFTYLKRAFNFSETNALEFIQQSLSSSQISVDKEGFLLDLTESTCMLIHEGLELSFSHRSFQEYFTAYFLARVRPDQFSRVLPSLIRRATYDNVFPMLSEMNKENFEETWVLPALEQISSITDHVDVDNKPLDYIRNIFGEFSCIFFDDHISYEIVTDTEISNTRFILCNLYNIFSQIRKADRYIDEVDVKFINKVKSGQALSGVARFEEYRGSSSKIRRVKVALTEADNAWLKEIYIGRLVKHEAKLLRELKNMLAATVHQRKIGLDFSLKLE